MLKKICVFCGSSIGNNAFAEAAEELAEEMVRRDMELIYGGGNIGLMGIIADRMLAAGGRVTGIMPQHLADHEIAHQKIHDLKIVDSMMERKKLLLEMSGAFIALPGGFGTLDEMSEAITWNQLKLMRKPVGFLNINKYYDHLIAFLDHAVEEGLIRREHRDSIIVEDLPEKILDRLKAFEGFPMDKWIRDIKSENR